MSKEPVKSINEPSGKGEYKTARERAQHITEEERMEIDRRQREDPEFIEHTKPEDPSPRPGQLTRDNVNPNIPSGPKERPLLPDGRVDPNAGGIVDPNTLGMEGVGGGKEPNYPPPREELRRQREEGAVDPKIAPEGEIYGSQYSINEPPGSNVVPDVPDVEPKEAGGPGPALAPAPAPKLAKGPEASDDPDEIEDELDQMKEEGEVETRGKPAPKKK